jgi:molybdopterin-guanine dinucleotide biosynthesis protein A
MAAEQLKMTAVVLAGQRDGEDELAQYAGVSCKAFAEIGGKPMLLRVLETLLASPCVGDVFLCGPDKERLEQQGEIERRIRAADVSWLPPGDSPSASAYDALRLLPPDDRVLLTTADHPLLSASIVSEFCDRSAEKDADVVIGLVPYALVQEKFPAMKKTVLRFRGSGLCGCNLFAFLTPAGREASNFWRRLESRRKNPLHMIRFLGWLTVVKYLLGRLRLEDALDTFSARLGIRVQAAMLTNGDAAVDVDSVSDYQIVRERFSR